MLATGSTIAPSVQVARWLSTHYKYVAVFEAYFDESGDPADPAVDFFSLGWFVAPANNWTKFTHSWGRVLRRKHVTVMHMKHFEHSIEEFSGWTQSEKDSFAAQLAGVLKNAFKVGQCHTMANEVWHKVVAPKMETNYKKKRGPYVFLLQSCLEELVEYGRRELPRGERIACIFDENKFVAQAAKDHYSLLKEARGWDDVLAGMTFENKREFVPLQAADMLAYEGYKDIVNIEEGSPRKRRKLLTNLMSSKNPIRLAVIDLAGFWREVEQNRTKPN